MCGVIAIAIAGCSSEGGDDGSPALRIHEVDAVVHGSITITVDATPAPAFHGVELSMRGERIGTASHAPFTFIIDSAAFADGPATIDATGIVARTGEALHASATTEIENGPPLMQIVAPAPDAAILGSPASGFHFAPIVSAVDGNGVDRIWAEIGGTEVDLGAGDGSVSLTLPPRGPEVPGDFVPVIFHAKDRSGEAIAQTIYVKGSNVALQAKLPEAQAITDLRALPGGGALVGIGSKIAYGVVLDRSVDAPVRAVPDGNVGPVVRLGEDSLYFWPESTGLRFVHAEGGAAPTTIFQLDAATQTRALGPVVLSANRVAVGWIDHATHSARLGLFTPQGGALSETSFAVPAGVSLGDGVLEAPDGKLLVPMAASYRIIDPSSGTTGPSWPSAEGTIVLADHDGIVARHRPDVASSEVHLAGFTDTTSPPAWDTVIEAEDVVLHAARAAGGGARVLVDTPTTTELRRYDVAGVETLWAAPSATHASLLSVVPDSGDLILRVEDGSLGGFEAVRLRTDGTAAWTIPIDIDPESLFALDDGAVVVAGHDAGSASAKVMTIGPEGMRWSDPSSILSLSRSIAHDGRVITVGADDFIAMVVEVRSLATGTLELRYRGEPLPSSPGAARLPLAWSDAWGVILTGGALPLGAPEHPKHTSALLGFLP